MSRKQKVKFKRSKNVRALSTKIYVKGPNLEVTDLYPYAKGKFRNTLFGKVFLDEVWELIKKIAVWIALFLITIAITFVVMKTSVFGALILFFVYFVMSLAAMVCYFISFRGNIIIRFQEFDFSKVVIKAREYAENSFTDFEKLKEKSPKERMEIYENLDALSKIVDDEAIRLRKLRILRTFEEEFSRDWDFETDTLILNDASNNLFSWYIKKIRLIDPNKVGEVTLRFCNIK